MSELPVDQEEAEQQSLIESSDGFELLANPYDRMEYVHLTDKLIHRLEGSDEEPKPDVVIFLDKSARPVSWLVRELWADLAREPGTDFSEGVVPKRPQFVYLNIDSKHNFSREDLKGLRSLFTVDLAEDADQTTDMPTHFDGKKILVVDEIGVSHATRVKAEAYVSTAFPEAEVDSYTWMDQGPQTNYGGQGKPPTFNAETFEFEGEYTMQPRLLKNNLRWYKDRSDKPDLPLGKKREYDDGRGIIDRDAATETELRSLEHPRRRHGKEWLSARPKELLPETVQLMREIKKLGQELRDGILPYWPAEDRSDFDERLKAATGMEPSDFTEFRQWFKNSWWIRWEDAIPAIKQRKPEQFSYKKAKHLGEKALAFARRTGLYE